MTGTAPLADPDFEPLHSASGLNVLVVFCQEYLLTDPVVLRYGQWKSIQPIIPCEAFVTMRCGVHFYFKN